MKICWKNDAQCGIFNILPFGKWPVVVLNVVLAQNLKMSVDLSQVMAQELQYSDLDHLCLHSHHLDSFQMQQSDLELNTWHSANSPRHLLWFQNGDSSWKVHKRLLNIPPKELSNSYAFPLLNVWSQKFLHMGLENVADQSTRQINFWGGLSKNKLSLHKVISEAQQFWRIQAF